jgi:hypothetical protein
LLLEKGNHSKKPGQISNLITMTGYSETPLPQKLGIKPSLTVVTINAPPDYRRLLGPIPENVTFSDRLKANSGFVPVFTKKRSELEKTLSVLREKIADAGTVWVSWPKKSSGIPADLTEDLIRAVALPLGFVDVKVCAIDETWSGLKLMVRKENRK